MARAEITVEAVHKAITEFDEIGRGAFLDKYGFAPSRSYFLVHDGHQYDSKAIVAVANKWAPGSDGKALRNDQLSGGENDAALRLRQLGFVVTSPDQTSSATVQDLDWSWDEHVLALDLYMSNPTSPPGKTSSEISELSRLLNRMGEAAKLPMTAKFRNPNGVYMKLMNFRRLDPTFQNQGKVGLDRGSRGEVAVWKRFAGDRAALRAAAAEIRERAQQQPRQAARSPDGLGPSLDAAQFQQAFARFRSLVAEHQNGAPFTNFHEGIAAAWEGYKPRLRAHAHALLDLDSWKWEQIGSGALLQRVIDAIEVQDGRTNLINNLVFWQNRYGHANRDHHRLLEARLRPSSMKAVEHWLFQLYKGGADEGAVFDQLSELTGAKYPLLAYLFFLKDMDRFMPIHPTGFDKAFRELGINFVTLRGCGWSNYRQYNLLLGEVRAHLRGVEGLSSANLVDAHSFCWLLVKLPDHATGAGRQDPGRFVGGREKSIIKMIYSIEETVRRANGQTVERVVKNKDLRMSRELLERLIRERLEVQGDRCALTGIPFHFDGPDADPSLLPSADRIDSSGHYEEGNIQLVCRFINFWKQASPNDEVIRLLALIRDRDVAR